MIEAIVSGEDKGLQPQNFTSEM